MITLIEFLESVKSKFVHRKVKRIIVSDSWVDSQTGTWWLTEWDEEVTEELDWEALQQQITEFEKRFKKD